jgi:hypothetical protein
MEVAVATLDQLLDGDRLERINTEARQIHFGRVVLTVLAAVFYGLGWITARTFGIIWLTLAWTAVAVKVGWTDGRKPRISR